MVLESVAGEGSADLGSQVNHRNSTWVSGYLLSSKTQVTKLHPGACGF